MVVCSVVDRDVNFDVRATSSVSSCDVAIDIERMYGYGWYGYGCMGRRKHEA
jgi:hypothetical protein